MKNSITAGFLLFCLSAGAVIGYRLTPDQLGVVVGVVLGVLAGIPFAVLLLVAVRSRRPEPMPTMPQASPQSPPIIIVGPGGAVPALSGETWPNVDQAVPNRDIRVVGEG